jgi:hypothetical protein
LNSYSGALVDEDRKDDDKILEFNKKQLDLEATVKINFFIKKRCKVIKSVLVMHNIRIFAPYFL